MQKVGGEGGEGGKGGEGGEGVEGGEGEGGVEVRPPTPDPYDAGK